jgi:hypothetical protein
MSGTTKRGVLPTLNKAEGHMLGLMHSAIDVNDGRVHKFGQWLNTPSFIRNQDKNKGSDVQKAPPVELFEPLAFADYSAESDQNYCGYGLKSIKKINKGDEIAKISL